MIVTGLAAFALVATACGDDGDPLSTGALTVFAAASLTSAFTELGDAFEATTPGARVTFNFAGSSALAAQILEGAPADVFASADVDNMTKLTDAGATGSEPIVFTTNRTQIVVGSGNPEGIAAVDDLADPDLIVVSCAPEVPCGRYAQQVLDNAGIEVTFRSLEENVRAVVSKVTLGEADAGIVYVTDVIDAGDQATGVAIPADVNVVAAYPMAVTSESTNPDGAQAFIDFVLSDEGQSILTSYGFVAP